MFGRSPIDAASWKMASDQAASIRLLSQQRPDDVLFYQEQKVRHGANGVPVRDADGKVIEDAAFIMAMMTKWQEEAALRYGRNGPLIIDATHGTNNLGVSGEEGDTLIFKCIY